MKIKTNFKTSDVENAVIEAYKARLLAGWCGCLKLQTNKHHIILTQYQSPNNWIRGYLTIFSLDNYYTWDEIEGFYLRDDGQIEIETIEQGTQGQYYSNAVIVTKEEAFERLRENGFFDAAIEQAGDAMLQEWAEK